MPTLDPSSQQVLILKWDCLYGRLLSEAVRSYHPSAVVTLERSVPAARAQLQARRFDLFIAGLSYPDGDGLQLAPWVVGSPQVRALLLVTLRKDAQTLGFLRQNRRISVFDPADDEPGRFAVAIGHALQGLRYVSASFHELLMSTDSAHHVLLTQLTLTEQMVLAVIGDGSDDKVAGDRLGMEASSVHSHRKRLMRKLGVQSREHLFRRALELGIVRILPDGQTARPAFEVLRAQIEAKKRDLTTKRVPVEAEAEG